MVKRLILLSLLVLALCGASALLSFAGGAPVCGPGAGYVPQPPGPPPVTGPASTSHSVVREQICPVPAQLRKVRVVAPYLAGIAWPRTPLAFGGNPATWPDPIAPGRYEWLVPVVEIKQDPGGDTPRCVYVKANYVKQDKQPCGPVQMAPPAPMPRKVSK
jgi:hypothetical protein